MRSDWGIERYVEETKRLYTVLDTRLQTSPYLAGEKFTIADIASVFWVRASTSTIGWDLSEWPAVKKWHDIILQREAVRRALKVPGSSTTDEQFAQMVAAKRREMMERANTDLH